MVLAVLAMPRIVWAETDSFTEATDVLLESHTPDSGGTWTKQLTRNGNVRSASDSMSFDVGDFSTGLYTINWTPATANYKIEFSMNQMSTGASPDDDVVCLIGRYTNTSNYYYACVMPSTASPDTYIGKVVAGVNTSLASGDCGVIANDAVAFRITDGEKKVQVNGADCGSLATTDNALTSPGVVGIGCGAIIAGRGNDDCHSSYRVDNFILTAISSSSPRGLLMGVHP